jgi:hypothetical protein
VTSAIDHPVIAAPDPDAAAREMEVTLGIAVTGGGEHAGLNVSGVDSRLRRLFGVAGRLRRGRRRGFGGLPPPHARNDQGETDRGHDDAGIRLIVVDDLHQPELEAERGQQERSRAEDDQKHAPSGHARNPSFSVTL